MSSDINYSNDVSFFLQAMALWGVYKVTVEPLRLFHPTVLRCVESSGTKKL